MERTSRVKQYILDTSVAVKWFTREEKDSAKALMLREQLLKGLCAITIPDLLLYEIANALKYNPKFSAKDVKDALDSILTMGIEIREIEGLILNEAIEIAFKLKVTTYDAYFIALSRREKKPLLTADYKLFNRVKSLKNIIKLSEM